MSMVLRRIECFVEVPEGLTDEELATYVYDALGSWRGSYDPADDLFHIGTEPIIQSITKPAHYPRAADCLIGGLV